MESLSVIRIALSASDDHLEDYMTQQRPFAQVDVFSSRPYHGNPVAVVLNAEGISDAIMLQIARWTNLSETTFILPPTRQDADYRLRIFTPGGELPFAGHPTLGSAHAWLENGGTPNSTGMIIQECEAGLVQILQRGDTLAFEAPPTLRSGDIDEDYRSRLIAACGLLPQQVVSHQWVDNGPGWAILRVATAQEVLAIEPDFSLVPDAMVGVIGAYPQGSPQDFEIRAFAPRIGVIEDPVCGSLNASVGQWFIRSGVVNGSYRVSQGQKLGRAGEIIITPDESGHIWVSGRTHTLFRGTARI